MVGEGRPDREEAGELAAVAKPLDHVIEVDVGEPVAVVGQEHVVVPHMFLPAHSRSPMLRQMPVSIRVTRQSL